MRNTNTTDKLSTLADAFRLTRWVWDQYDTQPVGTMSIPEIAKAAGVYLDAELTRDLPPFVQLWIATLKMYDLKKKDPAAADQWATLMAVGGLLCPHIWSMQLLMAEAHEVRWPPRQWRRWPDAMLAAGLEDSIKFKGQKNEQIAKMFDAIAQIMDQAGDKSEDTARIRTLKQRLYPTTR